MRTQYHPKKTVRKGVSKGSRRGFSLLVTIVVMILLSLLTVAVLSLSVVTLRSGRSDESQQIARTNALLALNLAIGELQKHAGPDQSVTGSASLGTDGADGGHLISVWRTGADIEDDEEGHLLASGNEDGDMTLETERDFTIVSDPDTRVTVKRVDIKKDDELQGRYGWWISDEGTKARIDLKTSDEEPETDTEKFARGRVPQETGIEVAVAELADLAEQIEDKRRLLSLDTLGVATSPEVPTKYLHDLTTGGAGLQVNVADGGMKTDLSLVFDTSQESNSSIQEIMGAGVTASGGTAGRRGSAGTPFSYEFTVSDQDRFYFATEELSGGGLPVGPNWGNLYSYAKLWKNVAAEETTVVAMSPKLNTELRTNSWVPYTDSAEGRDDQHTNSPVQPVLALLQMGFRMRSRGGETIGSGRRAEQGFQLQFEMKPVIGLWNPYNVKLTEQDFAIDWALYPYFRLGASDPDGTLFVRRVWMRENWANTGSDPLDTWFRMIARDVELEPGEIQYFSVTSETDLTGLNELDPGWNEDGGFVFDLTHSAFDDGRQGIEAGSKMVFPSGSLVWSGDLFLEDTQNDETVSNFPALKDLDGKSASWVTVKAGDAASDSIHRVSDIWQTPLDGQNISGWKVPEQILSPGSAAGTSSRKVTIDEFVDNPYHIGTWSWRARTSTEATENQATRGWADTNVRYGPSNPGWDGSVVDRRGNYTGWYFNSPMIGSTWGGDPDNPLSATQGNGDGGPGGRGKLAEGILGEPEPSGEIQGGKYVWIWRPLQLNRDRTKQCRAFRCSARTSRFSWSVPTCATFALQF